MNGNCEKATREKKADSSRSKQLPEKISKPHTYSAAPAAEAERQSSSDPALPSAHRLLPQPAVPYQNWEMLRIDIVMIGNCTQFTTLTHGFKHYA